MTFNRNIIQRFIVSSQHPSLLEKNDTKNGSKVKKNKLKNKKRFFLLSTHYPSVSHLPIVTMATCGVYCH